MYWYAGKPVEADLISLPVDHPALLYGATLFTTMRVYDRSLNHPRTDWPSHCDRLRVQIRLLQWLEPDWENVLQGVMWLANHQPVIRITILPDGTELITGRGLPTQIEDWRRKGIHAWIASGSLYERWLPGVKTGNYLGSWLALNHAREQGAQEAILVNGQGHWLETSTGNLWGWGDGLWWTPPLVDGILPGVARSHLMQALLQQGQVVREVSWSPEVVDRLEAIVHSNNVVEAIPLHCITGDGIERTYRVPHPALELLHQACQDGSMGI